MSATIDIVKYECTTFYKYVHEELKDILLNDIIVNIIKRYLPMMKLVMYKEIETRDNILRRIYQDEILVLDSHEVLFCKDKEIMIRFLVHGGVNAMGTYGDKVFVNFSGNKHYKSGIYKYSSTTKELICCDIKLDALLFNNNFYYCIRRNDVS